MMESLGDGHEGEDEAEEQTTIAVSLGVKLGHRLIFHSANFSSDRSIKSITAGPSPHLRPGGLKRDKKVLLVHRRGEGGKRQRRRARREEERGETVCEVKSKGKESKLR